MPIPWMMALKVIPWGDVIEHAPTVLKAARKLMDRQKTEPVLSTETAVDLAGEPLPSLGELKYRLVAAQAQIDQHAQTQAQLAETLAALAEQNAQLVGAVEVLRLRTRLLLWGVGVLALGVFYSVWRWV